MSGGTLGAMVSRIDEELHRTDIDSNVKQAIQTSIEHWGRERFYFNEAFTSWNTVSGTQNYSESTSTPPAKAMDILKVTVGSAIYRLMLVSFAEIEELTTNTSMTGPPSRFAYYAQNYWLYPIPGSAYAVTQYYVKEMNSVSWCASNSAANAWMTSGEELIRQRAKAILRCDVLHDPSAKSEATGLAGTGCLSVLEQSAFMKLSGETTARISSGRVRPYGPGHVRPYYP